MHDLVFPNNNEEEFISIAELLGFKELSFCYYNINEVMNFDSKKYKTGLKLSPVFFNKDNKKTNNISSLMKVDINSINQFENINSDLLFGFESISNKDGMHQRFSGLNQVMCKRFSKKNKIVCFSLNEILNSDSYTRAKLLGRVSQNIVLLKKYKVKVMMASFATTPYMMSGKYDLNSLFSCLGLSVKETKESLT